MALLALLAAGCGPSLKQVRGYVVTSPRRHLAVLPFSLAINQKQGIAPKMTEAFSARLPDYGFELAASSAVKNALPSPSWPATTLPPGPGAAKVGKALGVSAVLTGCIETALEKSRQVAAVTTRERVTLRDYQGNPAQVIERQVVLQPARVSREVSFSLRLRLLDAATGRVLWEGSENQDLQDTAWTFDDNAGVVMERLFDQFVEAFLAKKL